MPAKGYCTPQDVAGFLGLTFTADQIVFCSGLIERIEAEIDEATNRGWLVGEQTDEVYYPGNTWLIFLRYVPVESVDGITGRTGPGEAETALVENTDYEVRDLDAGLIRLLVGGYDRLLISYTPAATVPGDIKQAAIELAAARMQPNLQTGIYGVDSYSLPDLTVRFARSHFQDAAPPAVQRVLDYYRFRVYG